MSLKSIVGYSAILKHFGHASPLLLARQFNTSAFHYARGIRGTLKSLNIKEEEADDITMEDIENLTDPDLIALQSQSGRIEEDAARFQKFVQQKTIKQKYFKKYELAEETLLTWAMKEQLKYLHATDPDQWTPEALSTAFPISVVGAQKLLKSRWLPENEAALERHDRAVLARWQKYTNGQLGSARLLEEILKKKLGKSSEKLPTPLMNEDTILSTLESLEFENSPKVKTGYQNKRTKFPKPPKMKSGSFLSIIEDYEAQVKRKENPQGEEISQAMPQQVDASVITNGVPNYEGEYSKISMASTHTSSRRHKGNMSENSNKKEMKKMMTLDEFMKVKNIS